MNMMYRELKEKIEDFKGDRQRPQEKTDKPEETSKPPIVHPLHMQETRVAKVSRARGTLRTDNKTNGAPQNGRREKLGLKA